MSSDEKKSTEGSDLDGDKPRVPETALNMDAKGSEEDPELEDAVSELEAEDDYISLEPEPLADRTPRKRSLLGVFSWVLLFALILGLGAAAYYWQRNVYENDLASLREQLSAVTGAQSNVSTELESTVSAVTATAQSAVQGVDTLRAQIESQAAQQGDLARSLSALYERETQTSVDWTLAEAEYLILAATQRLALERDVDTAIAALRAADQRLRSADHPDLIPIRESIIADVTALEAVNLPPIEGLAISIGQWIEQVDSLPTKPIAEEVIAFDKTRSVEFDVGEWRKLGLAIWSDLVNLVEVKDADLPDAVLFDPELRYFLRQNLKLELASARLSVLRGDKANLHSSVGMIQRLLEAYYDVEHDGVTNMLKKLKEAESMDLTPALPNITRSLDVIRKHRASRISGQAPAP